MCCMNLSDHSKSIHENIRQLKESVNKLGEINTLQTPVGKDEARKPYKYDCLDSENVKPVTEIELKEQHSPDPFALGVEDTGDLQLVLVQLATLEDKTGEESGDLPGDYWQIDFAELPCKEWHSLIYLLIVSVLLISPTLGDMGIYMTDFDR
ncbi:hypothetical protein DUI87_00831 [Hirundo rustica rustica]|uniref:Uncharacterized protein n=1 Tax=Hirundo rustica rustica TaxID=333673 RepID=A0A3M0L4F4_HIRRU|nr:hypothetical protein DUI87_00831 [Hirundo rustica rustica]